MLFVKLRVLVNKFLQISVWSLQDQKDVGQFRYVRSFFLLDCAVFFDRCFDNDIIRDNNIKKLICENVVFEFTELSQNYYLS
jgi:hypothetical protein